MILAKVSKALVWVAFELVKGAGRLGRERERPGISGAVPGLVEVNLGLAVRTFDLSPVGSEVVALGGVEVGLPDLARAVFVTELEEDDATVCRSIRGLKMVLKCEFQRLLIMVSHEATTN